MTPAQPPKSPLEMSQDAKGNRDIHAEVGALVDGSRGLASASWYPARPGDRITICYEATATMGAFTETYVVAELPGFHANQITLALASVDPDTPDVRELSGVYAGEGDMGVGDPLMDIWMEAGPGRLRIERDGQLLHDGPATWQ